MSVHQRGKRWTYVMPDPVTGKQRWVGGFKSKTAAKKAEREALHRADRGQDPFPERITFTTFVDRWLQHLEANDKPRRRVRQEYGRLLRRWALPELSHRVLLTIRPADLQHVIDTAVSSGVKPGQLRAVLSSMFEQAVRWSLIPVNPARATTAPSTARPKLTVPTGEQLHELVEAARDTPWEIPILLACTSGARRAEILGAQWANVDLDHGLLGVQETLQRIDGKLVLVPPKTERSRRTIPLPAFAVARLRAHKADQARRRLELGGDWADWDLVCERGDGRPCDPDSLSHGFSRIARSVDLECRLHDCRHAVATALAKSGARPEVTSAILGHNSTTFTASVYTHPDAEQLEAAMRSVEDAFGSSD
jgi:integrase